YHVCSSAITSGASTSVGTGASWAVLSAAATAWSRGNHRTSASEAASQPIASATAVVLRPRAPRSCASALGSAPSGAFDLAAIANTPMTLTYIVRQTGQAWRRTKNEAYAK